MTWLDALILDGFKQLALACAMQVSKMVQELSDARQQARERGLAADRNASQLSEARERLAATEADLEDQRRKVCKGGGVGHSQTVISEASTRITCVQSPRSSVRNAPVPGAVLRRQGCWRRPDKPWKPVLSNSSASSLPQPPR